MNSNKNGSPLISSTSNSLSLPMVSGNLPPIGAKLSFSCVTLNSLAYSFNSRVMPGHVLKSENLNESSYLTPIDL